MNLSVWSEFLTPAELGQARVADLLARFECGVMVQVKPDGLTPELRVALDALAAAGVPRMGLWPLLDPAAGYWPSERNAPAVLEFTRRIVEWRSPATWLAIDLEPPLWQARWNGLRRAYDNLRPARFAAARDSFRQVIDAAHEAGLRVLCAAHEYLAEDVWLRRPVLQDLHEAPVLGLPWDLISVMLYGSLLPASPADRRRWLFDTARRLAEWRIGASIGLTAAGVLGNEPTYTSASDLAGDAAVLKAAGVDDFVIYSLEGILAAPDPAEWLRAVIDAKPETPSTSDWASRQRARRRVQDLLAAWWRASRR